MQKRLLTAGFILLFHSLRSQAPVDILHYSFQIDLSDSSDTIWGRATITFKAMKDLSSIELDLSNPDQGTGMNVQGIYEEDRDDNRRTFARNNDKLNINLGEMLKKGGTRKITILYWGVPRDGLIISKNKYGHRTIFADNWPNRAHNWIPCVDDPADKASVEFTVIAPAHYQVVGNGVMTEESNLPANKKLTRWAEDMPLPTKVMAIAVADFAVNYPGNVNDCIPLSTWMFPENKTEGFYDYEQAKEVLAWEIRYIGPYPFKKLANIQSKTIFGGMENASAIFYGEDSVSGKRDKERLLSHEIAHQWFGNSATEKDFSHLWLSEGFATYMTNLYIESKYGTATLNESMKEDRDKVIDFVKFSHRPVVDNTRDYLQLLNSNSYDKGSWVLHMLRRQLGDSVFQKSIRTYYATYASRNADTRDLQKIVESVSGKSFSAFFDQWLYKPFNPNLKVRWQWLEQQKAVSITVEQLQPDPFIFPLDIGIRTLSLRVEHLSISRKTETFTLPLKNKPQKLTLDPFVSLLFEGTIEEVR